MTTPLRFAEWEPIYEAILADFGYDRAADEHARDCAAEILADQRGTASDPDEFIATDSNTPTATGVTAAIDLAERVDLTSQIETETVRVVGAAPSLSAELESAAFDENDVVIAASTAADVLADHGIDVDCMVTDLDKNVETACELTSRGIPVVAHVHGDNIPVVREWLPQFDLGATLVTTQAAPRGPVANYGGFTDGDRAAFLADALGASTLRFSGWNFDDPTVDPMKARKLRWAEHLLFWLEKRRGERFDALAGRRESLSTNLLALSTK